MKNTYNNEDPDSNEGLSLDKVKKVLEMSVDENDKDLQNRFVEMRSKALAHIPEKSIKKPNWLLAWPALGTLSAAFILVVVLVLPKDSGVTEEYALDDLDILTEADDLEMLAGHELEFYVWLEQEMGEKG